MRSPCFGAPSLGSQIALRRSAPHRRRNPLSPRPRRSPGGTPTFRSEHFDIHPVGKRIWAAIGRPISGATGNAGIIDLGGTILVFDSFLTMQASADLRSAAQFLTGQIPTEVVNSHGHLDHTLGNAAFGASTIHGTEATRHYVGKNGPEMLARAADPSWVDVMAVLQERLGAENRPLFRRELAGELAAGHELREAGERRVRAPDAVFTDRFRFAGERGAMIVSGSGHSESDTVLFVTDDEVLFTGDLLTTGFHPTVGLADLAKWRETLDKIVNIAPKVVVPGHGPVTTVDACAELQAYLEVLEATAASDSDEIPPEYAEWESPGRFLRSLAFLRSAGT